MRLLILGGTGDATELLAKASLLPQLQIMTSLAGRTQHPVVPAGAVRIGGFGGVEGLVTYLQQHQIDLLIDATHPFAAQISHHAAAAAAACGIPHLILSRPAWQPVPGDRWLDVERIEAAATILPDRAKRVFLTTGRQQLAAFAHLESLWFLMRMIDPPLSGTAVPPGELLFDRGPFSLQDELTLMTHYGIDTVVSKNSGGEATYAKIRAARELGLPVVMVRRPMLPAAEVAPDIPAAMAWLTRHIHP
ncbi:cobalt-precorrin-6A reductase [Leptolyngbya sp. 'hensonii']|nr:cobalt-precorrin-6A reductase [Leptolyngbya sp. 'hensonii']